MQSGQGATVYESGNRRSFSGEVETKEKWTGSIHIFVADTSSLHEINMDSWESMSEVYGVLPEIVLN